MSQTEWVDASAITDIPSDDVVGVEVAGRNIALYSAKGQIFATDNICSHGQAEL